MKKLPTILISVAFATILNLSTWQVDNALAAEIPQGFTGQEQHSESILDYGARYYDADLARFPQADKVDVFEMSGNPQDLNAYAYVKNNPVNRVDPTGNSDEQIVDPNYLTGVFSNTYSQNYSNIVTGVCCNNGGYEYLDGVRLDTPFDIENLANEEDVAAEYYNSLMGRMGVSPGAGTIIKTVWDEALRIATLGERMLGNGFLSNADKIDIAMAPFGGVAMKTLGNNLISDGAATKMGHFLNPDNMTNNSFKYLKKITGDINWNIAAIRNEMFGEMAEHLSSYTVKKTASSGIQAGIKTVFLQTHYNKNYRINSDYKIVSY